VTGIVTSAVSLPTLMVSPLPAIGNPSATNGNPRHQRRRPAGTR